LVVVEKSPHESFPAELEAKIKKRRPIIFWPKGLSLPLDVFTPRDKTASRSRFGLPTDRTIILLAGAGANDPPAKLEPMLSALEPLTSRDLLFVSIGRFDNSPTDQTLRIWNLNETMDDSDRAAAIGAADIVLDSGSGAASLEAAACGRPSIGFGSPNTIMHGLSGLISADSQAMTSHLRTLAEDSVLRNRMGAWARIWVENEFSPAAEYHRLFLRLDEAGLIEQLRLPPKISFQRDGFESPPVPTPGRATIADPVLSSQIAALKAERDSLQATVQGVTETRLWRMVAVVYPMYQRVLGSRGMPKFVRNGIQKMGNWIAARPKNA
jgi:hypothetical protein